MTSDLSVGQLPLLSLALLFQFLTSLSELHHLQTQLKYTHRYSRHMTNEHVAMVTKGLA